MQLKKVPCDAILYHHRYKAYLKKCPEFLIWPGYKKLTPKGIESLQNIQPVSVVEDAASESYHLIAGVRTFLAAKVHTPKVISAIVYDVDELSGKAIHEIICADLYLSVLPYVVSKGGMARLIATSQLIPQGIWTKWFQDHVTRKHILPQILPVTSTHVKKVLSNDNFD